jgi:hypothetical protein
VVVPWPGGGDGWGFGTAEQGAEQNRPRLRVFYTPGTALPPVVLQPPSVTSSNVIVRFSGEVGKTYTVLRAATVNGTYTSGGTATVQPDGTATFTDSSPLPGSAFYRVTYP